jgi:hypothetical protein
MNKTLTPTNKDWQEIEKFMCETDGCQSILESLIPEKKGFPFIGFDSDFQYGQVNGFNKAIEIMQEAVKSK